MHFVRQALFVGCVLTLAGCGGGELGTAVEAETPGQTQAPLLEAAPGRAIAGQYIVVLKKGAALQLSARSAGVSPRFTYSIINGFAASLSDAQLTSLRNHPDVEYVEQDSVIEPFTTQLNAPWALDRIDQRTLPLNGTYTFTSRASDVTAYIIDSGINTGHPDFGGRAAVAYDATGGDGKDCNGHGTYVAGLVGGTVYGVAKGVQLRSVRVLNCVTPGSLSNLIAGMDWVRVRAVKPAVAVVSLGTSFSTAVNSSAKNLALSGVFLSVAAGNEGLNACNYSPGSTPEVCTVGATTSADACSTYSNSGPCVDVYAPGSSVVSDWFNGGTSTQSGTSGASALVGGAGALYKATYGDVASASVCSWIQTNASPISCGKLLYKDAL